MEKFSVNNNGYWHKYEYDANGKETYYENSNGDWCKTEDDANGNVTYFENSNGSWEKSDYAEHGIPQLQIDTLGIGQTAADIDEEISSESKRR